MNETVAPPFALEAEQSLIGSIAVDKTAYYEIRALVGPEDFYREAHQVLFRVLASLYEREQAVDIVTASEQLRVHNELEKAGGYLYVQACMDCMPTAANAVWYAEIVRRTSLRRRLMELAARLTLLARHEEKPIEEILGVAQTGILEMVNSRAVGEWQAFRELIPAVFNKIEDAYRNDTPIVGVPSGIKALDETTAGFCASDLIILAARPSIGKTAFAQQIAEYAAAKGVPVGIFSLEMSCEQLGYRAIQAGSNVSGYTLRRGKVADDAWKRIFNAIGRATELPIYVNDRPALSYLDIQSQARRAVMEYHAGLIVIDYLQLIRGPKGESRNREVGTVAEAMKATAKELKIPVILLSQLSRRCEIDKRRPILSDLRDSGDIEAVTDVVIFIHKPAFDKNAIELIVAKNRQLATGTVHATWLPHIMRFAESTDREENE